MNEQKRTEQEIRERSDARYSIPCIPCMHCTHLVSVGGQFDDVGWTCKAFPEQILYRILTVRAPHTAPTASQVGTYVYDPVIYTEEDTGRKWHYNAAGTWQYIRE